MGRAARINAERRAESLSHLAIGVQVPWNAGWSSEEEYDVRPCRWVGGRLALWSPSRQGEGRPVFAKPHMVRQRQSVAQLLCTVCGKHTPTDDRWWFRLGHAQEGFFMTTEAPVHHACATHALKVCPHLRGRADELERFPKDYVVLSALVGGPATDRDFCVAIAGRKVIGHLKLAWPLHAFEMKPKQ